MRGVAQRAGWRWLFLIEVSSDTMSRRLSNDESRAFLRFLLGSSHLDSCQLVPPKQRAGLGVERGGSMKGIPRSSSLLSPR
jgi:hypothetical protein